MWHLNIIIRLMIRFVKGDLLESDAAVLVNTVNTVGVMGKGIALQFKEAYQNNFRQYKKACQEGRVQVGRMFITEDTNIFGQEKVIVNFPTKTTWRLPSQYSYIQDGLKDLREQIASHKWPSIAIPPLGSHNGGLEWDKVRRMIQDALSDLECDIQIYEPSDVIVEKMKAERVRLTPARAMLLYMLCMMTAEGEFPSEFASEKIAYFLQRFGAGDVFNLKFTKQLYGPYSGKVRFVLHNLNGSYLKGMGQMEQKPFDYLWLAPDTLQVVTDYLSIPTHQKYKSICDQAASFLSGFFSNYLLELLSTTDYILHQDKALTGWREKNAEELLETVESCIWNWNDRKRKMFCNEKHILIVLKHLKQMQAA